MRRNPDEEINQLRQQLDLGDESVVNSLWNLLELYGEIPEYLQKLLSLCGENELNATFIHGWTRWLEEPYGPWKEGEGELKTSIRFYSVLLAYASLLASLEYYSEEFEYLKKLPESKAGWKKTEDLDIKMILKLASKWLRINAIGPIGMGSASNLNKIADMLSRHLNLPLVGIRHQEVGKSLISSIFDIRLDSDEARQPYKSSHQLNLESMFLRNVVKSIYEPAWDLVHTIVCPYDEHHLGFVLNIDYLGDFSEAPRISLRCFAFYAQSAYLDAIQAFRSNILSPENRNVFDMIWRRKIKYLLLKTLII